MSLSSTSLHLNTKLTLEIYSSANVIGEHYRIFNIFAEVVESYTGVKLWACMTDFFIRFYSTYGHVAKLAEEIKKGAASVEGVEVKIWQVSLNIHVVLYE